MSEALETPRYHAILLTERKLATTLSVSDEAQELILSDARAL